MEELTRIRPRKFEKIWVGDFETTTIESQYFKKHKKGRVIAWEIQELRNDTNYFQGCSLQEFESWFLTLKGNHQIYFHNAGRFDNFVFLNYALSHWYNKLTPNNSEIEYSYIKTRNKIMGFYIRHRRTKQTVVINDSILLLLYSIKDLGKMFNCPKLTTDYNIEPVDKLEDLPKDYLDYLHQDVKILNVALSKFAEDVEKVNAKYNITKGWNKMTMANLSRTLISAVDINEKYKISFESQEKAREFYRGGYTCLNKSIEDTIIYGNFKMIDAKSHYPSIMSLFKLPAYEPIKINAKEIDDYECVFVKITGIIRRNKNDWGTIPVKGEFDRYIVNADYTPFEFAGSYVEWSIQEKFYEFESWTYQEIWGFEETQNVMNDVIKDFYKLKETEANPLTYKLFLNSIYGSCGMKANYPETFFVKDNEDPPFQFLNKNKTKGYIFANYKRTCYFEGYKEVEYATQLPGNTKCWNRWIAAYITSIGRYILQKFISYSPKHVYYGDTDSLLIDDAYPLHMIKLGKGLGDWDIDKDNLTEFIVQGPKRYILGSNDKTVKTSFSGIRKDLFTETFQDNADIFGQEIIDLGQQKAIISKDYDWFPLIIKNDYKNHRKIALNKMKGIDNEI